MPARVRVHLGIEHEDVDFGARGEDVVEAAIPIQCIVTIIVSVPVIVRYV